MPVPSAASKHAAASDPELVEAWRTGDRMAGEVLIQRHYDTVVRFFNKKVSDPYELVQRTFLVCMESPSGFRGESKFRTFLLGVAKVLLRNHQRDSVRRRRWVTGDLALLEDALCSPSQLLILVEQERLVLDALRRLPVDAQLLLELRFWERIKQRELAELFGVSQATIKNDLRRCVARLRAEVAELARAPRARHVPPVSLDDWATQIRGAMSRRPDGDDSSSGSSPRRPGLARSANPSVVPRA